MAESLDRSLGPCRPLPRDIKGHVVLEAARSWPHEREESDVSFDGGRIRWPTEERMIGRCHRPGDVARGVDRDVVRVEDVLTVPAVDDRSAAEIVEGQHAGGQDARRHWRAR